MPRLPSKSAHLTIHKFGGAALADAAAMRHVAGLLRSSSGARRVVVASAMYGVTERLVAAALEAATGRAGAAEAAVAGLRASHEAVARALLGEHTRELAGAQRGMDALFAELSNVFSGVAQRRVLAPEDTDRIVTFGERASCELLARALRADGQSVELVAATDVVFTDGRFGGAAPDLARTEPAARARLEPLLARGIMPIVPGFFGRGPDGAITTFGRGGSDLTATVIARVLRADDVVLWKDVPGFLTADPRVVPTARSVPALDRREAAELAYYGARVLHPRALIPLDESTRIIVRSFNDAGAPGSVILPRRGSGGSLVRALAAVDRQALVTVSGNGMLGVPGIAARTFSALAAARISVTLITQASSEHSISLAVPGESATQARRVLADAFAPEIALGEIDGVDVRPDLSIVAVVGLGMARMPGVAARIFGALARASINVVAIAQGSSELNVSIVVDAARSGDAQRAIHDAFSLGKRGGGRVAARPRCDVVLLGFGRIGRELSRQIAELDPAARAGLRLVGVIDRAGYVFDPRGLSPRRLDALSLHKQRGGSVATATGGHAGASADALRAIADHALSRPILVDVTAGDTRAALLEALDAGFDLVLANKVPLSSDHASAAALLHGARERGRRVFHEATVGAGLPIMDAIEKLVASGDRVRAIEGCPSGTLGFLFSELAEGRRFSEALRDAMALGYTEPDPRDDLSGLDVARKALLLGRLLGFEGELADTALESLVPAAYAPLPLEEFLARLPELDAHWAARVGEAQEQGGVLRYRVRATRRSVEARLVAVPARSPLASLQGTDNQFAFTTLRYRDTPLIITGPGAGPSVTAGGVLSDVLRAMRTRSSSRVTPSPRQRSAAPRERRRGPGSPARS